MKAADNIKRRFYLYVPENIDKPVQLYVSNFSWKKIIIPNLPVSFEMLLIFRGDSPFTEAVKECPYANLDEVHPISYFLEFLKINDLDVYEFELKFADAEIKMKRFVENDAVFEIDRKDYQNSFMMIKNCIQMNPNVYESILHNAGYLVTIDESGKVSSKEKMNSMSDHFDNLYNEICKRNTKDMEEHPENWAPQDGEELGKLKVPQTSFLIDLDDFGRMIPGVE